MPQGLVLAGLGGGYLDVAVMIRYLTYLTYG